VSVHALGCAHECAALFHATHMCTCARPTMPLTDPVVTVPAHARTPRMHTPFACIHLLRAHTPFACTHPLHACALCVRTAGVGEALGGAPARCSRSNSSSSSSSSRSSRQSTRSKGWAKQDRWRGPPVGPAGHTLPWRTSTAARCVC